MRYIATLKRRGKPSYRVIRYSAGVLICRGRYVESFRTGLAANRECGRQLVATSRHLRPREARMLARLLADWEGTA